MFENAILYPARLIAVIGGNHCSLAEAQYAEDVGKLLAENEVGLVCGGRNGIMAAACRGARKAGGITIGLLPGDDPSEANQDVVIAIPTGMGIGRNILVVRSASAVIAIGGKYGTLSEIAFALQLEIPVFGLSSWENIPGIIPVNSPAEAVGKALESLEK